MITAFPIWNNRIAPVFDVACQLHLLESDCGNVITERQIVLAQGLPALRALELKRLGVDELVCGAISQPMEAAVTIQGILVTPFISGALPEIIQAWLDGTLKNGCFAMPGCCGRWKQRHPDNQTTNLKENFMNGKGKGGMGGGMGGGRGQGGPGRGRMGGPMAAGPDGFCICPKCGKKEPHQRGVPCNQVMCPDCGVAMTRTT